MKTEQDLLSCLPLQSFLAKEVSLIQGANVFLLGWVGLLHGNFDFALAYDEERITSGTLSNDVVTFLVERLGEKITLVFENGRFIFVLQF